MSFIDACAVPGHTELLAGADDGVEVVALPFAFRYWATNLPAFSPINITSNGWIGLDGVRSNVFGIAIPQPTPPNAVVAGYAGDGNNRGSQCIATVGTAPNRVWVHEWNDARHCCAETTPAVRTTYEIILNENDYTIALVYQTMTNARPQVVGLENQAGTASVGGCFDGSSNCAPASGYAVRFVPIP